MKNKPSFIYQAGVLIHRYFHIFFNDKKNLLLKIAIPLMTIILVCLVACGNMYSIKPQKDRRINNGFPVLSWETVVQEKESEDKNSEDNDLIKPDKSTVSKWNGTTSEAPMTATKINGENYFLITGAEQLAFLSQAADNGSQDYLTYNYLLQCDIDLNDKEFHPIGTQKYPFTGTFDGNGHIISNLVIEEAHEHTGFFGCISEHAKQKSDVTVKNPLNGAEMEMVFRHNGFVKDFQLKQVTIKSAKGNVGAVAGMIDNFTRIRSISVKGGSITAKGKNVGGLVGVVKGENAQIYLCYSTASVNGYKKNTGGLVGDLDGSMLSGCYFNGRVKHKGSEEPEQIGALVGSVSGAVSDQLKNVVYNSEEELEYQAVDREDTDSVAFGITADQLKNYASFLVPFKDIMSRYDALHLSDQDKERYNQKNYDVEKDNSIDNEYGFKKDDQLSVFGATQTGLFMLVCVAIFTGICNSIQEICKERSILKREYMTNLNLGSYVISKLVVQAVVCAVQMAVVVLIFMLFVIQKQLPEHGVFFSSIWIEYFITMFLLAFAADVMSLFISSIVKSSELANTFIPIILIVQIVFSGVLFEMNGFMNLLAKFMISRWGIDALAAITSLNDAQPIFLIENPSLQLQLGSSLSTVNSEYASTAGNLLTIWGILLAFIVVFALACGLCLRNVKNDKR